MRSMGLKIQSRHLHIGEKPLLFQKRSIIGSIAPGRESELVAKCGYNSGYIIRTLYNVPYIGANSQYFNNNCSIVELFKILIEKYQCLFLEHILPIITDDSFETYLNRRHLEELFKFQYTADNDVYLKWCEKNGSSAAEFVASFLPLLKEDNGNMIWTNEAKKLMNKYNNGSYVLSIISTRLFNGEVSIAKYSRLKKVYELLNDNDNTTIRLWAIEQSENMDQHIQREKDQTEVERIWYK